ncbi:DUF305 domain-containing protein [Phytohabitans rumicis]|uniref:Lipoprotein n=1 Tax=Phytohabitans rumicis TaxID=1076125 RepID=A0A6V8LPT4_9ACTN|nr:DUF305 domain-containing protein [Phytohabitans rumicis]GFJ96659.1 lipoprotein [Phytohabitans rumicis]
MTRVNTRRFLLPAAAALATVILAAGCGDGGNEAGDLNHGGTASPTGAASSNATFNDVDVRFAQMMIPHHEQAVQMATLAQTRASDPQVKQLAVQVKAAQDPEITTMTGWLTTWGQSTAAHDSGHDMASMPGMMSDDDMAKLKAATGTAFDRMFVDMMIAHHKGAIQMAQDEQSNGAHPQAKALAATIEKTQTAEITTLETILERL